MRALGVLAVARFSRQIVSSDGESPLLPAACLKSGFHPSRVSFGKSVENVRVTGVESANMVGDAESQVAHFYELKTILADDFQKSHLEKKQTC